MPTNVDNWAPVAFYEFANFWRAFFKLTFGKQIINVYVSALQASFADSMQFVGASLLEKKMGDLATTRAEIETLELKKKRLEEASKKAETRKKVNGKKKRYA